MLDIAQLHRVSGQNHSQGAVLHPVRLMVRLGKSGNAGTRTWVTWVSQNKENYPADGKRSFSLEGEKLFKKHYNNRPYSKETDDNKCLKTETLKCQEPTSK